jgi:cysteine-rich repeat protein
MKTINKKLKQGIKRKIVLLSLAALLLNVVATGMFSPAENVSRANENMCEASVDIVMIMDRSGSMNEGEVRSKCEWTEVRKIPGSNNWTHFLNIKYDQLEDWCMNKRDQYDETFQYGSPKAAAYTPATNKKIFDAKFAANAFLGNLGANDKSALVSFADNANLDKQLSSDHNVTQIAVDSLTTSGSTNIGEAIAMGTTEFGSERANSQAVKAMILLTDGKANRPNGNGFDENQDDISLAIASAQDAANLGYKIFTIGLGSNSGINEMMLQQIANDTGANYYNAPTSAELEGIYAQISTRICEYGSISGCKYNDSNNDGNLSGEKIIPNWQIELSGGVNDPIVQQTDLNGCYNFAGLATGNYTVSEVQQDGWLQTYPLDNSYSFNLGKEENITGKDFGNYFPECGNSISDEGEQCDDGNLDNGDNCSSSCQIEIIEHKQCSDEIDNDEDGLTDYPFDPGCDSAEDNNEYDEPVSPYCGDSIKNNNEECDGSDGISDNQLCSDECSIIFLPYCGDGLKNGNEQCDGQDGISNGQTCSINCAIEENNNKEESKCDNGETNNHYSGPEVTAGVGICKAGIRACAEGSWGEYVGEITPQTEICGNGIDEDCNGSDASCGGGGSSSSGGGASIITKPSIIITNEKVSYLGSGEALVTWETNIETTEQVVYGDNSVLDLGSAPKYGYDLTNLESSDMIKSHNVAISGLIDGITYYFRPVADRNGSTGEVVGKEVSYEFEEKGEEKGEVKGAMDAPIETAPCNFLSAYIKLGADNNPVEVKKMEGFLNEFEGENLAVNGIYEQTDFDAVSRFQNKYSEKVLSPWNYQESTGYVYITTKKKINEIYCEKEFSLTPDQEAEIANFRARLLSIVGGGGEYFLSDISKLEENNAKFSAEAGDKEGEVKGAKSEEIAGTNADENKNKNDSEINEDKNAGDETANQEESGENKQTESSSNNYLIIFFVILLIVLAYYIFGYKKKQD